MSSPWDDWPAPVVIKQHEPCLVLALLTQSEKRLVWNHLQSMHPETANDFEFLHRDEKLTALMDQFQGSSLVLEAKYLPRSLVKKLNHKIK